MPKLKPTILIALDAHAAAFCERAQAKLERDLGYSGSLIQSYALTVDGNACPAIERTLSNIADFSFNLAKAKDQIDREIPADFDFGQLQPQLSEILQAGTQAAEIQKAHAAGIEIATPRVIYLIVSAVRSGAGRTAIELARLIHWLFVTRFPQTLYELHATVLLPNLFEQSSDNDFAAAYEVLREMDRSLSSDLTITPTRKERAFAGCWLLDGLNAHGERIGTLAEELESYTDAFTGFVTAEPERSGALIGTRTSRGKVPAYSTFGHGELYFPAEMAVTRLSSALARDVIDQGFLITTVTERDVGREMLFSAKQLVLSDTYRNTLNGLETDKGALIWKGLSRTNESQRESNPLEYISEIQRQHEQFEREALPKFKQALLTRGDTCSKELIALVDMELDRRIDQKREGIRQVPALLRQLVDHSIALHTNILGERPENFITDLFAAEAILDTTLAVSVDHSKTDELLKRVNELNNRLSDLEAAVRISNLSEVTPAPDESEVDGEENNEHQPAEQNKLLSDIEETRSEIATASQLYVRELIAEQRLANQMRYEAKDQERTNRAAAVKTAEEELTRTVERVRVARLDLEHKQQQRQQFLVRHFILYPVLTGLLFVVPVLGAVFGIPLLAVLGAFILLSLFGFAVAATIGFVCYAAVVLYIFANGIDKAVKATRQEVTSLELQLKADRVRLIDAHNLQLRLEYEIYAQSVRVDTLNQLIKTTGDRITELENTLKTLAECRSKFQALHESTLPSWSYMRRPVFDGTHIDSSYPRLITNVENEATIFIRDHMPRSQVRHIPIEDFEKKLQNFASSRFQTLSNLSIQDVLLRSPDLISEAEATLRLRELDRASTPLLLLSDMNLNDDTFAQKDVTIWAGETDSEALLERYRKVNSTTTLRPSENGHTLRALTRCLNFPAFYLGQIEFYRACYERIQASGDSAVPDLIPDDLSISSDLRRAYEQLLIALATGVIDVNGNGTYQLVDGSGFVAAGSRREVAEKFVTDYSSQKVYGEIANRVAVLDSDKVYQALIQFAKGTASLEPFEREMLNTLSQKHHPLR